MSTPIRCLLLLMGLTSLAGCGDCGAGVADEPRSGLPYSSPDGGGEEASCTVDDDCPFGQVCREGLCRPSDPLLHDEGCWSDDDCGEGMLCAVATGRCVPAPASPPPPPPPGGECSSGQTRNCGTKVGVCEYGTELCVENAWSGQCEGGVAASDERCDTLDNDCDGDADEDFVLGAACSAGQGVCQRSGTTVCAGDGAGTVCDAVPLDASGRVELCGNGLDDNCDGAVDEGFEEVGGACTVGTGVCARSGQYICSADATALRCSATPGTPGPLELCGNGDDDNCDGRVDEGFEALGSACTLGTPPCEVAGTWICSADLATLECQVAGGDELCNGRDDTGEGCVDEGFDVGAACSVGLGVCRASGVKRCTSDGLGTECDATPGLPDPFGELCGNGLDDDCNGQIDEGFADLNTVCSSGDGICQRAGAVICALDGRGTVCDAVPGAPDPLGELCDNGLDDDCNGTADDGFDVGAACSVGQGICLTSGVKICSPDGRATICDATPGLPNPAGELCGNGLDDDCDTFTDEGFGNLGNACTVGLGACRASGTYICTQDGLGTVCSATAGTPTTERCDDIDNDCNGVRDDGCDSDNDDYCDATMTVVGSPSACPLTTGAATLDCNDDDPTVHPGATEICGDARDQNCDGNPNDGCTACNPAIDADYDGADECEDCDETNGAVYPGAEERCDGVDNDCDDDVDEGYDGDGDSYTTCGTVLPGGGLDPAWVDCNDGAATIHPFADELCTAGAATVTCAQANDRGNGVDEDCNGYLDDCCTPCDTTDPDGDGVSACLGDCAPEDPEMSPLLAEVCDGKDNDCNTTTTENCDVGDPCNFEEDPDVPEADECRDRLLCVESLGPGGQQTGDYSCTSFCNFSQLGAGLGDGCTSTQTCSSWLTPTANLHGCSVATDIGALAAGQECGNDDSRCRSGVCTKEWRLTGPPHYYCMDYCGSDAYCPAGTSCQLVYGYTGNCWVLLSNQTRDVGESCEDTGVWCRAGSLACLDMGDGEKRCTRTCCDNSDCPGSYFCSLNGGDYLGPLGWGYETVPVCWPEAAGAHDRPAGAACTSSGQCESEFCDLTLDICIDICCNDGDCPLGMTCDDQVVLKRNAHYTIARVCSNFTLADDEHLEAR